MGVPTRAEQAVLLTAAEVAARFGVHRVTLVRWAEAGRLTAVRTPGGYRRYIKAEVDALLVEAGGR